MGQFTEVATNIYRKYSPTGGSNSIVSMCFVRDERWLETFRKVFREQTLRQLGAGGA